MSKKTLGLIAEYNPFHNGHKWQLEHAKNTLKADYVVVAMSGNYTQRGIPAIIDKYERTKLALENGADLVIEMPVIGATSSAEIFAKCGISLLNETGVVNELIFGSETTDKDLFINTAEALSDESFTFKKALRDNLKSGLNFAKARSNALVTSTGNRSYADFIETPNNILGIEYVKAIKKINAKIDFTPILRNGSFDSSTTIRNQIELSGMYDGNKFDVPKDTYNILNKRYDDNLLLFPNDFSLLLHEKLVRNEEFISYLDSDETLSNRTKSHKKDYMNLKDFAINELKTKNYTLSHINRYLAHIFLDVTYTDFGILKSLDYAPYIHILGVKENSKELLSNIKKNSKIPVFTSYKDAIKNLSEKELMLYNKDLLASDIYRVVQTAKSGFTHVNERNRGLITI